MWWDAVSDFTPGVVLLCSFGVSHSSGPHLLLLASAICLMGEPQFGRGENNFYGERECIMTTCWGAPSPVHLQHFVTCLSIAANCAECCSLCPVLGMHGAGCGVCACLWRIRHVCACNHSDVCRGETMHRLWCGVVCVCADMPRTIIPMTIACMFHAQF